MFCFRTYLAAKQRQIVWKRAMMRAGDALTQYAVALNGNKPGIPLPCDLSEIRLNGNWASTHGVDWSTAVVTMMPLRA